MKKECIHPNCNRPQKARGLCASCYSTLWRLISEQRVTEEQMIQSGRILPAHSNHKSHWFEQGAVEVASV